MNDTIPIPTEQDWEAYDTYRATHDSASEAAKRLRISKNLLIERMLRASTWLRVSGWTDAFNEAVQWGFSIADARDHADQKATYNMRAEK